MMKKEPAYERMHENVYRVADSELTHHYDSSAYLVMGDAPALVDCGSGKAHNKLLGVLASLGARPENIAVVLGTHCHYDHIAGIERLRKENPALPLALHEADAAPVETADSERTCAGWFFGERISPQRVDILMTSRQSLDIAGLTFECIHTPGHTPGSACFRVEVSGKTILFTGDCLVPGSSRIMSDYDDWRGSLETLADIDFDILLPGHKRLWLGDPFLACLKQPFSKPLGRKAFKLLQKNLRRGHWRNASAVYSHIMPLAARLGGALSR